MLSPARALKKREHVVLDDFEHLGCGHVLERRPTKVTVQPTLGTTLRPELLLFRKNLALDRLTGTIRLVLRQRLLLVQTLDEQQVGELLHHLQRIRYAPRPEVIPNRINLALQLPRDHRPPFQPNQRVDASAHRKAGSLATLHRTLCSAVRSTTRGHLEIFCHLDQRGNNPNSIGPTSELENMRAFMIFYTSTVSALLTIGNGTCTDRRHRHV